MKGQKKWVALAAVLLLVLLVLLVSLVQDDPSLTEASSVSLGLMLLEQEQGLYVLAVTQDSPADRAGVFPGDRIIASQGMAITHVNQLERLLDSAGESLPLTLLREGREQQILLLVR